MKKASFQVLKNPIKKPQVRARCSVLAKKCRIFCERLATRTLGRVSDGVQGVFPSSQNRLRVASDKGTSKKRISTPGSSSRQRARSVGKRAGVIPSDRRHAQLPMKSVGCCFHAVACLLQRSKYPAHMLQNKAPARVSRVLRVECANSATPNSSFGSLMARDSGDCSICSGTEARANGVPPLLLQNTEDGATPLLGFALALH